MLNGFIKITDYRNHSFLLLWNICIMCWVTVLATCCQVLKTFLHRLSFS